VVTPRSLRQGGRRSEVLCITAEFRRTNYSQKAMGAAWKDFSIEVRYSTISPSSRYFVFLHLRSTPKMRLWQRQSYADRADQATWQLSVGCRSCRRSSRCTTYRTNHLLWTMLGRLQPLTVSMSFGLSVRGWSADCWGGRRGGDCRSRSHPTRRYQQLALS